MIGFNHHTLTKSVPQNAVDFLSQLPSGNCQFDVISHSRGGLLARALKELTPAQLGQLVEPAWAPPPGVNVQIGKIILVGTPNVGTPLADPSDLAKAISRLASIATSFSQDVAAVGLGAAVQAPTVAAAVLRVSLASVGGHSVLLPEAPLTLRVVGCPAADGAFL